MKYIIIITEREKSVYYDTKSRTHKSKALVNSPTNMRHGNQQRWQGWVGGGKNSWLKTQVKVIISWIYEWFSSIKKKIPTVQKVNQENT